MLAISCVAQGCLNVGGQTRNLSDGGHPGTRPDHQTTNLVAVIQISLRLLPSQVRPPLPGADRSVLQHHGLRQPGTHAQVRGPGIHVRGHVNAMQSS